jgi:hypothetical protein
MTNRFYVRTTPKGFGVFDAAVNGWTSRQDLTKDQADQISDERNAAIEAINNAKPKTRRTVEPPRKVHARIEGAVVEGILHAWDRANGGWMGEVELKPDRRIWVKADDLRPA